MPGRRRIFVYLGLTALALVAVLATARFDTSVKINLVNDIYRRVLPRPHVSSRFQDEYGMPQGPYTLRCRGEHVLSRCLGRAILRVGNVNGSYDLRPAPQGFVRWLEQHGRRTYISYLLLDAPAETWASFRLEYAELLEGDAIRYVLEYLGWRRPGNAPNNRESIEGSGPGRAVGFLGFDSLSLGGIALDELRTAFARAPRSASGGWYTGCRARAAGLRRPRWLRRHSHRE